MGLSLFVKATVAFQMLDLVVNVHVCTAEMPPPQISGQHLQVQWSCRRPKSVKDRHPLRVPMVIVVLMS